MKLKLNNVELEIVDIEIGGVDTSDFGDFCDAYVEAATIDNGDGTFTACTFDECDELTEAYPEMVNELAMESII